jgi:hypothetical protein
LFTTTSVNSTDEINESTVALLSPSVSPTKLESSILTLLQLYPDDPALGSSLHSVAVSFTSYPFPPAGSPFNTGNNTFGLSSQFKRASAIGGREYI